MIGVMVPSVFALEANPKNVDVSSSSVEVIISGNLDDFKSYERLILTITSPDKSETEYDVRITGTGIFSKTFTVSNEWDYGTYDVTAKYGDQNLGSTSFMIEPPYDPRIGTSPVNPSPVEEDIITSSSVTIATQAGEETPVEKVKISSNKLEILDNYPVKIKIIIPTTDIDFGNVVPVTIEFDPPTPNTPVEIIIFSNDYSYNANGKIVTKTSENKDAVVGKITFAELDNNWIFRDSNGHIFNLVYTPGDLPSGTYHLVVTFGNQDITIGKAKQEFTFTNNNNSPGNQLKNYFPTMIDIGTSFELVEHVYHGSLLSGALEIYCHTTSCKNSIVQKYVKNADQWNPSSNFDLKLIEFDTVKDAKHYAAIHWEWDGPPSSAGNKLATHSPSSINSESKQCFEFSGGYWSANTADGLLKCTNGRFVAQIQNTDQDAHDLVNGLIKKIDSLNIDTSDRVNLNSENIKNSETKSMVCGSGTIEKEGVCVVGTQSQTNETSSNGGGCLIATATYGSEMATEVQQLRELRDNQLLQTESGTAFMGTFNDIYYSFSPVIADYERENPLFKEAVKLVITPMISSLSLMENAESESEVLGLGLSVIALNLGMYLGIPAIVVIGIRKKF